MVELYILFFLFGIIVGSFQNVLILRLPLEQDVVFTSSHCPKCKNKLKWFHNIPLFGYLLLRGKCAFCGTKISKQYPFIELLAGLISLWLMPEKFILPHLLQYLFFFTTLIVFITHIVIDLRYKILPNELNAFLLVTFLFFAVFNFSVMHWGFGLLVGLFLPLSVAYGFYKLRGVEGLGGGDIKLFAILGIYLGPLGIIQNIFLSCFVGSIVGVGLIYSGKIDRDYAIPFGPSIILVAFAQMYFPNEMTYLFKAVGFFTY